MALPASLDAGMVRQVVLRHMVRASTHAFNLARVRAQSHEEEMIDILYTMAMDPVLPAAHRRLCALDVLEQARGKVVAQVHDGATIDPRAPATDGTDRDTGAQIEAARIAVAEMNAINEWASTPFEQWPEHVRALLGADMGAAFTADTD